nr:IS3 family transposase [Sporomusa silvacetica]
MFFCSSRCSQFTVRSKNWSRYTRTMPSDNAVMESFYRTLKREPIQDASYDTPEQARMEIFKYIETYRIHSTLGWLSPLQFELQNCQKA